MHLLTLIKDFNGAGNAGYMVGPGGHNSTFYTYDLMNRILSKTDAVGIVTVFAYDAEGNLIEQTVDYTPDGVTGRNVVTRLTYDSDGLLVKEYTAVERLDCSDFVWL